ncbi:MAG: glycosyltransferase family 4 protein, partial [Spirochaetales bacterium]|nr:glycosyltransferase family 4 protein [Spirochaetales bacterium]
GIADGVTVHRIPTLTRNPGVHDVRALASLRRLMRDGNYRIVHTHGAKAGILARMAAHRERVPIIINGIHGHTFSPQMHPIARAIYRAVERRVARYTTHFVPVGDDLRKQYLAAGVGDDGRYTVIHSGMELSRYTAAATIEEEERRSIRAEFGIPEDAVVFANISRMEPRKGHRFFLEAARGVVDDAVAQPGKNEPRFVIVGDGPEETNLRAQAESLGIGEKIIFTGYRGDVERMFAMCDVVVLTSLWEGLPRVLVQAAAAAKPVVTFACDGASEVVEDDVNGWVVPMRDVDAVRRRLSRLIEDAGLRRRMGEAGRRKVNDTWTVETMVRDIESLYERLLRERA